MLTTNTLFLTMSRTHLSYATLKRVFEEFAKFVACRLQGGASNIQGIEFNLDHLAENHFDVTLVGQTVRFVFSLKREDASTLVGAVTCWRVDTLNGQDAGLGSFTFDYQGKTNLPYAPENKPLYIDEGSDALHVVLHFLNESLSM